MPNKFPSYHTQYGDLLGVAALDWEGTGFVDLLRDNGIDVDRYHLVGVRLWGMPPSQCTLFVVDKSELGDSFDDIRAYAKRNDGAVPVEEFHLRLSIQELSKFVKQFSVDLLKRDSEIKSLITGEPHYIESADPTRY